jgi:hypothetical protein
MIQFDIAAQAYTTLLNASSSFLSGKHEFEAIVLLFPRGPHRGLTRENENDGKIGSHNSWNSCAVRSGGSFSKHPSSWRVNGLYFACIRRYLVGEAPVGRLRSELENAPSFHYGCH